MLDDARPAGVTELHIGELHLRVEDHSTNSYASAIAGYAMHITGSVSMPTGTNPIVDGRIAYGGGDIGWQAYGDNNGSGIGPMVGYLYWQDEPDTGRINYTTANNASDITYDPLTGQTFVPGTSVRNAVDAHVLRLGISGKAKLGEMFDITGTIAGVPYAKVGGTVGIDDPTFSVAEYPGPAQDPYGGELGNISSIRSSTAVASLSSALERSCGVAYPQPSKAASAAAYARSTSSWPDCGAVA